MFCSVQEIYEIRVENLLYDLYCPQESLGVGRKLDEVRILPENAVDLGQAIEKM